jgi:hypothetical protein
MYAYRQVRHNHAACVACTSQSREVFYNAFRGKKPQGAKAVLDGCVPILHTHEISVRSRLRVTTRDLFVVVCRQQLRGPSLAGSGAEIGRGAFLAEKRKSGSNDGSLHRLQY